MHCYKVKKSGEVFQHSFENCFVQDGRTALHLAAESFSDGVKKMELLIDKGANVTAVDKVNMFKMILTEEWKKIIMVISRH